MIWLTWRQFRAPAAVVLGALLIAAIALTVTGPQLADLLRVSGEDFFGRLGSDRTKMAVYTAGTALAYIVPAVVGAFWGAPLVARKLEAELTGWCGTKASHGPGGSPPSSEWRPSRPQSPGPSDWA